MNITLRKPAWHARLVVGIGAAILITGLSPAAQAAATYSGAVTAALRVTGIQGAAQPEGDYNPLLMDATKQQDAVGNATAAASGGTQVFAGGQAQTGPEVGDGIFPGTPFGVEQPGPAPDFAVGEGVLQTAAVSGTTAAPFGLSLTGFFSNGNVFLTNSSFEEGATISLALDFSYTGTITVDDPALDSAALNIDIRVIGSTLGDIIVIQDSLVGAGSLADSGRREFQIDLGSILDFSLPPTEDLLILANVTGSATSVAEPGSLALLGIGLAGAAARVRRRPAATGVRSAQPGPITVSGSHSAIWGNTDSSTMATTMHSMNGSEPRRMVGSRTSGAMPLMT